jgi:LPS sulfotransferase NodH
MNIATAHPATRAGLAPRRVVPVSPTAAAMPRAEPAPDPVVEAANEAFREACVSRRLVDIVAAARLSEPQHPPGSPAQTLMRLLAGCQPAPIAAPGEETLWMLQRIDGTLVSVVRLRDGGRVGHATHANESHWRIGDGHLVFGTPDGRVTTAFSVGAVAGGQRVMLGLFMDSKTVHVLSEVDCAYTRMRLLDPELIGTCSGLVDPAQLAKVVLPPVPAVILAAQRTGSHLLLNLLNSTGRVFFDAEILNEKQISVFAGNLRHEDAGLLHFVREHDPVYFAKAMMTRSHHIDGRRLDAIPVRGFKLFAKHSKTAMDWVMDEPQMRIVHLHRANLLAEYSSLLVAYAEGHWVGGPEALRRRRIDFDSGRFLRFVEMKRRYLASVRERLAARSGPSIEIEYGEFTRPRLNDVLGFLLGAPQDVPFESLGLKRQLAERVIDRFDNPDDVRRCLDALGEPHWAGIEQPEITGF